jgi:polysaccharide deacetylase family protein (PEP-CTERM system associated)
MSAIVNGMSVDVEDYFQVSAFDRVVSRSDWPNMESRVVANTERLLELYDRCGVRATFFILGWVADRFPGLVRRIAGAGHEIASHGFHHHLVYTLTPDEFRADVRHARTLLEDIAGCRVRGYRAPSFSITQASLWALDVLIEEGYEYDTSIFPIYHDRYGIAGAPREVHVIDRPSGRIVEVPGSTIRIAGLNLAIAGGGYFRLMPYQWTCRAIARVNNDEQRPVVFYLHPWEVDPEQPRFAVSAQTRLRHYHGLKSTLPRLEKLLHRFTFDTVSSVIERSGVLQASCAA